MKVDIAVDVGNSRIKWGLCIGGAVELSVSLPPDDADAWQHQLERWSLAPPLSWAISGVHPQRRDRLAAWVQARGDSILMLEKADQLPLVVGVGYPDRVGIDRLLNAVAAKDRVKREVSLVIIDAGSAITVRGPRPPSCSARTSSPRWRCGARGRRGTSQ